MTRGHEVAVPWHAPLQPARVHGTAHPARPSISMDVTSRGFPLRELLQDLRYGARLLVRQPSFTSVVVATLALAIGANTVIFSIASFLLLRPLPFQDPDTIAAVWSVDPQLGNDRARVSDADLVEWRHEAQSFVALGGFSDDTHTMTGRGDAERLQSMRVTANLFDIWGIPATAGRRFQAGDDTPGAAPVVMLSDGFWQRRFGADPGIVGDTLVLDATPHTVIGIVTPEMELGTMSLTDIWVPYVLDPQAPRDARRLAVYGRLKPGVGIETATAEIATIAERQARDNPVTNTGWSAQVMPLLQAMTGSNTWLILSLLVLVVSFVLVIACANIANLMLARGVGRRKELAVRAAIGAGRFRLVRQLLAESLLFGMAGGLLGLVVAEGGLRAIKAVTYEPFFKQIEMDYRVLAFVALLSIVTPVLFAFLPALSAARMNLSEVIGEGEGRTSGGRRGKRSRNALVIAQLSLAATLLVLSTLIIQVAAAQSRLDVGFDPTNVLTLQIELDGPRYGDDEAVRQFGDAAIERLEGLPGVARVAITSTLPVFSRAPTVSFEIEGRPVPQRDDQPWALQSTVSPGYFSTFDIPLVRGRSFVEADGPDAPAVALVSAETARRYWPDGDPVGRRVRMSGSEDWIEIVGVVADVFNQRELVDSFNPAVYVPLAQHPRRAMAIAARTAVAPDTLIDAVRSRIRDLDPDQAVFDVKSMDQNFREALATDRMLQGMFSSFALLALVLATGGLYGLMSYSVAQRRREFGVRLALGASTGDVTRQVVGQGMRLAAVGLAVGLTGGLALAYATSSLLFGVEPTDPTTYATVAATLLGVTLVASYLPVRRALTRNPIDALRQ